MNKFILKITLEGNYNLIIDIIHWDKRFVYDSKNDKLPFCYFQGSDQFTIYTLDKGGIRLNSLEIPEYKYMYDQFGNFKGSKINKHFLSDYERYTYLKKLHKCLFEWSTNYSKFKNDIINNDKIILNNKYWIL